MTQSNLRLTIFQAEKLKNIVGFGGASPYQISTYPGSSLGMFGTVARPEESEAVNCDHFGIERASAVSRVFRKLGLKSA